MPLVRVEVRNEYGLGAAELYREGNNDDAKEVLDGAAVAGLVGILRQLGDLAEFSAEVFHGLQEEVMITSSRSRKVMTRVKRIEAAISPLEKAVLAQRSHLHFAYTAGSNWHSRIRCEQNHFTHSDLPHFIMDSYEGCRGPPDLHRLDKFDLGGPGSCLKRYSDPTFFRRASGGPSEVKSEKLPKDKRTAKIKKRKSLPGSGRISRGASFANHSGRMQCTRLNANGESSPTKTTSTYDATFKSNLQKQSNLDSRNESTYIECASHHDNSKQSEEQVSQGSTPSKSHQYDFSGYNFLNEKGAYMYEDSPNNLSQDQTGRNSSSIAWDEKTGSPDPVAQEYSHDGLVHQYDHDDMRHVCYHDRNSEPFSPHVDEKIWEDQAATFDTVDKQPSVKIPSVMESGNNQLDDMESETDHFMDALNTIESESETDVDSIVKQEMDYYPKLRGKVEEDGLREYFFKVEEKVESDGLQEHYSKVEEEVEDDGLQEHGPLESECNTSNTEPVTVTNSSFVIDGNGLYPSSEAQESSSATYFSISNITEKYDLNPVCSKELAPVIDGNGLYPSSKAQESSSATYSSISNIAEKDDLNPVCSKELAPQQSECLSSDLKSDALPSPSEPYSSTARVSDEDKQNSICSKNFEPQQSECRSSSFGSDILARSSLRSNGNEHVHNVQSLKSPPGANSPTSEVADNKNPVSLEPNIQSPERARKLVKPVNQQISHPHANADMSDGLYVKSVSHRISSTDFREDTGGMPISESTRNRESGPGPFPVTSVQFWTNGGLLGLEPSKPPDLSSLNALSQDPVAGKDAKFSTSDQHAVLSTGKDAGKPAKLQSIDNSNPSLDMDSPRLDQDCEGGHFSFRKISWKISPADLDVKPGKSSDSNYASGRLDHANMDNSMMASRSSGPVSSDVQATKDIQQNGRTSSRIFEFGSKFLANGSSRPAGDENLSPASYPAVCILEQKKHKPVAFRKFSGRSKDLFENGSPFISPTSSPPLEHMKISFQPVDGFETSKLKLRFPDGKNHQESVGDIFPSFQLVPEASFTRHDVGLDSDDETFYRSSPSVSDDCVSRHSESNSEDWESRGSSKDHGLYDTLRRISLTESVSTTAENGRMSHGEIHDDCGYQFPVVDNYVDYSQSCHSFDLSSVNTQNQSFREELRKDSHMEELMESRFAPTPPPPPLPPAQWRNMTLHLDNMKGPDVMSGGLDSASNPKLFASTISQQPKPAPIKQDHIMATKNMLVTAKQEDQRKKNGRREANQASRIDEKDDFLHQIRTKSFNLRPTMTAKPNATSGGPANVQVTAILEKANAIRQAVGSDDGEDNWSDT